MQPQDVLWIQLKMGQNDSVGTMYDPCTQPDHVVCRNTGLEGFLDRRVELPASTCSRGIQSSSIHHKQTDLLYNSLTTFYLYY